MSNQLKITNLQDTLYHFNAFMSDEQEVRACTIISSPLPSSTLAPLAYKSWPTPLYVFTLPYASNNYPQRRAYRQRGEGGDEGEHGTERRSNRAVPPRADHKNKSKIKAKIARQSDRQRGRERKGKESMQRYLTYYLVDSDGTICQLVGPPRESTISPSSIPTHFIQPTPTNLKHHIHIHTTSTTPIPFSSQQVHITILHLWSDRKERGIH